MWKLAELYAPPPFSRSLIFLMNKYAKGLSLPLLFETPAIEEGVHEDCTVRPYNVI